MENYLSRIRNAFKNSRKLNGFQPNEDQLSNVYNRLKQIFTDAELTAMEEKQFMRQVERVWPIAKYVDQQN
jgi:uncharacterized coiled-coil DUF342 family protein